MVDLVDPLPVPDVCTVRALHHPEPWWDGRGGHLCGAVIRGPSVQALLMGERTQADSMLFAPDEQCDWRMWPFTRAKAVTSAGPNHNAAAVAACGTDEPSFASGQRVGPY